MKFKALHPNFKPPVYSSPGAAAFDIRTPEAFTLVPGTPITIGLGFAAEVPKGQGGLILPRSGLGSKLGVALNNTAGLIDSDYRGEWRATLTTKEPCAFEVGDRILQCMVLPITQVSIEIVDELSETERGDGGYGHTGVK